MRKIKIKFTHIVLLIILSSVLFLYLRNIIIQNEIDKNKFTTVAIILKFNKYSGKRSNDVIYAFYFEGKPYKSIQNCNDFIIHEGKFYKVDVSTLNPNNSRINLDKEVKDSLEIVKAGFDW